MIETVIKTINIEIADLDQFDNIYELYQKTTVRGEIKAPNRYVSSGNQSFLNWDKAPLIYHRINGDITREAEDGPSAKSVLIRETTPMRCVGYAKRIHGEDEYSPERIARNVATKIGFSSAPALRIALQMFTVKATVTAISVDSEEVWDDETDEITQKLKSDHTLFAVDYEIEFFGRQDCYALQLCN